MSERLCDVLNGREGNHLLPFLWMHDGHRDELPALVEQIHASGARAFCVESRPHEQFARQGWWEDMDVVLAEAKKRGMKVWILDDKHFPTGYANGLIREKYPHLRKWQLVEEHVDVVGPAPQSAVLLGVDASRQDDLGCAAVEDMGDAEDVLLGVYAYRRGGYEETLSAEAIDLTANVRGRYVFWDIPEGVYRVFALYKSRRGADQKDYIHMIDPESVHVLIEAVYEPHYQRYAGEFGRTIAGFFSDEPSLGNRRLVGGGETPSMYDQKLGQPGLALPWSDALLEDMNRRLGGDCRDRLAGLWYPQGDGMPEVRLAYMDALTRRWRSAFSLQLGEWCRAHGVEYIGHIIEDMNAHMRLSCSAGHYFRALAGQDMAGIDVVLHQIMPGMAHHVHTASAAGGMADPEFFDYMLARLAASLSHIEPRMKNRAMCEVFGAYGWAEGVPMMKHLLDHMLVRGVNHFVPHAFSPKYPDPDCPPHFNAGGSNPEFSAFAKLMRYANQTAHLLEGGTEVVGAAILYTAEAEWSGRTSMLPQKPAKRLCDAQINYDFLPLDVIMEKACVESGTLCVEEMRYPSLIVPYAQWLPEPFLQKLAALEAQGLRLAFVDGRPEGCACGEVIPLDGVEAFARRSNGTDVEVRPVFPLLRALHVRRGAEDVFMLVNESMTQPFEGEVQFPVNGPAVKLDLQLAAASRVDANAGRLKLRLGCGQSTLLLFGGDCEGFEPERTCFEGRPLEASWKLSLRRAHRDRDYAEAKETEQLYNVTGPEGDPDFSGWMRYEAGFKAEPGAQVLDLGRVGECAHVWLNGRDLGERMDAPYVYDVRGAVQPGENHLVVEVTNSLVHQQPDYFSRFVQIGPSGLLGPVRLLYGAE